MLLDCEELETWGKFQKVMVSDDFIQTCLFLRNSCKKQMYDIEREGGEGMRWWIY